MQVIDQVLFVHGHIAEVVLEPAVVLGVDDALIRPDAERMHTRDAERQVEPFGERQRGEAPLHQFTGRVREVDVLGR